MGEFRWKVLECRGGLHKVGSKYKTYLDSAPDTWLSTDISKDINVKMQRKEFCGNGKRISAAVMERLDHDIEQAKNANDRSLKKALKRQ